MVTAPKHVGFRLQSRFLFAFVIVNLWLPVYSSGTFAHSPHDDVFDVRVSPDFIEDKTIYALVRSVLLKSLDGGETWNRIVRGLDHKHMLYRFDMSQDGKTMFIASLGDGIYRSRDSGVTWEKANNGLETGFIGNIVLAPDRPEVAVVTSVAGNLYLTENSGDTWKSLRGPFGKVTAIVIAPKPSHHIFIGDDRGTLYRSINNGLSWTVLHQLKSAVAITAIALSPSYPAIPLILLGTSTGEVVRLVHGIDLPAETTLSLARQPILSITFSPEFEIDEVAFISSWQDGVHRTTNGGFNWDHHSDGLTRDRQSDQLGRPSFGRLSISPNFKVDRTVFMAGFDGMFKTEDGGRRWEEVTTLSPLNIVGLGISPNHDEDSTIALTTWMWGAYLSRDRGNTWRGINRGAVDKRRPNGLTRLFRIVFSPGYANDGTLFTSTWWHFMKSTNRGGKWRQTIPVEEPVWTKTHHGCSIAVSPDYREDGTLFIGTHTGLILRSTNHGATFDLVHNMEKSIGSIVISPDFTADHTVLAGDTDGVYISRDSGREWQFTNLVSASHHTVIPIPTEYPVDKKRPWKAHQLLARSKAFAIKLALSNDFGSDATGFAGTAFGLFKTQNSGRSWYQLQGLRFGDHAYIETIAISPNFSKDQTLIVSVRGRGHFRSSDGGKSFSEIGLELMRSQTLLAQYVGMIPKFPAIVYSPTFNIDKTIYGFSGPEIFKSVDNGETWSLIPKPSITWQRVWGWYLSAKRGYKRKIAALSLIAIFSFSTGMFILRFRRKRG